MQKLISRLQALPKINTPYVSRPSMFDLFKGWAMIAIIIHHVFTNYDEELLLSGHLYYAKAFFIYLFRIMSLGWAIIPMFFMVCGWGIKPIPFKKHLKNQAKFLLKPVLYVFALSLPCSYIIHYILTRDKNNAISAVHGILLSFLEGVVIIDNDARHLPSILTFWFVFALFWGTLLLNLILRHIPEKYQFLTISLISFITASIPWKYLPNNFAVFSSFVAIFFIFAGYLIKKKKLLNIYIHPIIYCILVILWLIQTFFSVVNLQYPSLGLDFIDVITSTLFAFMFIRLTLYIDSKVHNPLSDFLHFIGRYSMWMLSIHTFEHLCIPWNLLIGSFSHHLFLDFLITCLIRVTINLLLLYLIIQFNKLNPLSKFKK